PDRQLCWNSPAVRAPLKALRWITGSDVSPPASPFLRTTARRRRAVGDRRRAWPPQAARRAAAREPRAFQGNRASRAATVSAVGRFSNRKFRYAPGSRPLARAVATRE